MTFIDTNVFVYVVDHRNEEKQAVARRIFSDAIGSASYVISGQVLNEFAHVALKKLHMTEDEVCACLDAFQTIRLVPADAGWTRRGLELKKTYGVQLYDALMLVAAQTAGCDEILTEDLNDGQVYGGVRAINPFK